MKSEKETIYDYATELKLLAFKEELEYTLSLAAGENLERKVSEEGNVEENQG